MSQSHEHVHTSPRRSKRLSKMSANAEPRKARINTRKPSKMKTTRPRKRTEPGKHLDLEEREESPRRYNFRRQTREKRSVNQTSEDIEDNLRLLPMLSSFTAGIADPYDPHTKMRFLDVAFLGDDHLLCLEDNYYGFSGHSKLCCFTIEERMLSVLPLPDFPTRICVLSNSEVIVSSKGQETGGLTWLSIESETKNIRQSRHVTLETVLLGFLIVKNNIFVTHYRSTFMTVLDMDGNFIRTIAVSYGSPWRGLYLEEHDFVLWLYCDENKIRAINLEGEELFSADTGHSPAAIVRDHVGNIYVEGIHMCLCQYQMSENRMVLAHKIDSCLGLSLNKESDILAVAHKHSISFLRVQIDAA